MLHTKLKHMNTWSQHPLQHNSDGWNRQDRRWHNFIRQSRIVSSVTLNICFVNTGSARSGTAVVFVLNGRAHELEGRKIRAPTFDVRMISVYWCRSTRKCGLLPIWDKVSPRWENSSIPKQKCFEGEPSFLPQRLRHDIGSNIKSAGVCHSYGTDRSTK